MDIRLPDKHNFVNHFCLQSFLSEQSFPSLSMSCCSKLKEDVLETLCETGISKKEISNKIDKFHRTGKTNKNNTQNTMVKFKSHSFKEKIYFKRKAVKDVKIKPTLTKHRIELLKNTNTLITDNPGTNFLFTYADVHGNLKIRLKNARNGREVVRFDNEKDFNQLFAKSF